VLRRQDCPSTGRVAAVHCGLRLDRSKSRGRRPNPWRTILFMPSISSVIVIVPAGRDRGRRQARSAPCRSENCEGHCSEPGEDGPESELLLERLRPACFRGICSRAPSSAANLAISTWFAPSWRWRNRVKPARARKRSAPARMSSAPRNHDFHGRTRTLTVTACATAVFFRRQPQRPGVVAGPDPAIAQKKGKRGCEKIIWNQILAGVGLGIPFTYSSLWDSLDNLECLRRYLQRRRVFIGKTASGNDRAMQLEIFCSCPNRQGRDPALTVSARNNIARSVEDLNSR